MTQPSLDEKQLAELSEIVEIARTAEQKTRELYEMATAFAQKSQDRSETTFATPEKQPD